MADVLNGRQFLRDRTRDHAEMVLHYFRKLTNPLEVDAFEQKWTDEHFEIEAREAWHYAQLLSAEEIAEMLAVRPYFTEF